MANAFDDLIPDHPAPAAQKGAPQHTAPAKKGAVMKNAFDDLIPDHPVNDPAESNVAASSTPQQTHYSLRNAIGSAWSNLPQSAANFAGNVANAVRHPRQTAKAVLDIAQGVAALNPDNIANAPGGASVNAKVVAKLKPVADDYRAHYGSYDAMKRTLAEDPIRFGTDVASVLAPFDAAPEAGINALARVSPAAANATNALAHTAATVANPLRLANPTARAAGHAVRAVANALDPEGRMVLRATEGRTPAIITNLQDPAREIVPGSVPMAHQAAAPAGSTRFAALVEDAAKRHSTPAHEIRNDQNTARFAHIQGQIPHQNVPAAEAARDARAAADYGALHGTIVPGDQDLLDLMGRDVMPDVFEEARKIASNEGRQFQIGHNVPAHTIRSTVIGPNGLPIQINVPAQFASYTGRDLHTIKQAFDAVGFAKAREFGIDAAQTRAVRNARNAFISWMEQPNKLPGYATARANYHAASTPIDQSRLLNYYLAKLQSPLTGEDTATLRADAFAAARDNGLNEALGNSNIKKATGQQRVLHERQLLTPQQIQALDEVQADLARAKVAEQQAKAGSQHKGNLATAATDAKDSAVPGVISAPAAVINALGKVFTNHLDQRIADQVGRAMLNPDDAAELLSNALAREDRRNALSAHAHRAGNAVRGINRYPGVHNALQAERDAQNNRNALNR